MRPHVTACTARHPGDYREEVGTNDHWHSVRIEATADGEVGTQPRAATSGQSAGRGSPGLPGVLLSLSQIFRACLLCNRSHTFKQLA
jgi:hypothetical protein